MLAPDPKFEWTGKDLEDIERRRPSAFEEAGYLWYGNEWVGHQVPGLRFCEALLELSRKKVKISIIYSEIDTYALWKNNLQRLEKMSIPGIEWIALKCMKKKIIWAANGKKISMSLKPEGNSDDDWAHFALPKNWELTSEKQS